ncbi:hypothetical protein ACOSQ3_027551 [Xanthoceras sorbifolium]
MLLGRGNCLRGPGFGVSRFHRFQFEACWADDQECQDIVQSVWESTTISTGLGSIIARINSCADKLQRWSKQQNVRLKLGIKNKKQELLNASAAIGPGSWRSIRRLESDLDCLLAKEEIYWKQRSRVEWLKSGDKNTRFFHSTASARKTRNTIKGPFNSHGVWCEGGREVELIVSQYFSNIFASSNPSRGWNESLVRSAFLPDDATTILSIPSSAAQVDDMLVWNFDPSGTYYVQTGYHVRLSVSFMAGCSAVGFSHFRDFFLLCSSHLQQQDVEFICVVWWRIWFNRNRVVHSLPSLGSELIVNWSYDFVQQFRTANCVGVGESVRHQVRWSAPPINFFKINTDASVCSQNGKAGAGVVIRNHLGKVLASKSIVLAVGSSVLIAESLALYHGLLFAKQVGLIPAILETDCLVAVNALKAGDIVCSEAGLVLFDNLELLKDCPGSSVQFVPRSANGAAHVLAHFSLSLNVDCCWFEDFPVGLRNVVSLDNQVTG